MGIKYYDEDTIVKMLVDITSQPADWARRELSLVPTADVAPVVHAHWIAIGIDCDMPTCFRCSICRQHAIRKGDFCPNCGAKMDEEVKKDEN